MPIDLPDGRHDCAPDRETHGLDAWTCPGCGKGWELHEGNVWYAAGTYDPDWRAKAAAAAKANPHPEDVD